MGSLFINTIIQDCEVIIVDDCIGSGEQFTNFWNDAQIKNNINFRSWCMGNNIKVYYVVLVGYGETIQELEEKFDNVEFVCVETLSNSHNVMNNLLKDEIFQKEKENLENYLLELNIPFKGFDDLTFAIIIHNNIPDWTLPIFHKCRNEWEPLLRRKDSDV